MNALINLYPEDLTIGDVIEDYLPDDSKRRGEILNIDPEEGGRWLRVGAGPNQWSVFVEEDEELIVEREL